MARTLEQVATMIEQMHILIDIITASNVFPLHLHYLEHVSIHYSIIHSFKGHKKKSSLFQYIYAQLPTYIHAYLKSFDQYREQAISQYLSSGKKKSDHSPTTLITQKDHCSHYRTQGEYNA